MPLKIEVFSNNGNPSKKFANVEYLSFVSGDTYGIPALLQEKDGNIRILYVNTGAVSAVDVERVD